MKILEDFNLIVTDLEELEESNKNDYNKFEIKIEDNCIRLYGFKKIEDKRDGLGSNLKYYKTKFIGGAHTDKGKRNLVNFSTEMLCLKEQCFDLVKSQSHYKIFKNHKDKFLGIIYDDQGINEFKIEIKELDKRINAYVFSLDDSVREEEFEDVIDLVELKPIPEVILNVYRRIFK